LYPNGPPNRSYRVAQVAQSGELRKRLLRSTAHIADVRR